ncbi:glycosyltransferase family 4 protein [Texcoconibacillus texcoconensis]|uniref:UDP-GlcNAc:undecaprenyl-phosphate GlcNAc-1-phosphate transferase n=1 Tax=Texcoconibacillus texcoconensis TaxID=1095777 RepID=A0A840QQY2_9BACI|nr:MraY family glycosyltransferase [Texcoconibacillus texcoconensis]MBB5173775.1 UDP-GlcNAc:undecaprenyl-phosphate GlcNAc-1-phosphate transferase [Texcoconibacillus texcoconensis]
MYIAVLLISFLAALSLTPLVKRFAIKIGATDQPNNRKVHQKVMPRLGGLAIYASFMIGLLILQPDSPYVWPIVIGATIIVVTGVLDDMYELSAKWKLVGQILAAVSVIAGGVHVDFINMPFDGRIDLGIFAIPITLLWIIGVTNAINLIDGLDGLAAGVSAIVLLTITTMAAMNGDIFIVAIASILLVSTVGFLFYNFHPAKIFMGDTGALFLGFMLSVISLLGFKNVTLFSLIIPVVILAVPISDTFFAIIRRFLNKTPLSSPDKSHLHHCLLRLGFSHKQTVLLIYLMSGFFGTAAILLTQSTLWGALIIITLLMIAIELIVELVGLVGDKYRPLMNLFRRESNPKRQ